MTNNGAGTGIGTGNAGMNSFGNFNQYNTLNNCTMADVTYALSPLIRIAGSTVLEPVWVPPFMATLLSAPSSRASQLPTMSWTLPLPVNINGPGQGLSLGKTNACVNNNTFGTGLGAAISSNSGTNRGSGNVLNGLSSNLTLGTCVGP